MQKPQQSGFAPAGDLKDQFETLGKGVLQDTASAPVEILGNMPSQLFGAANNSVQKPEDVQAEQQKIAVKKAKERRRTQALQNEIKDIQQQGENMEIQKQMEIQEEARKQQATQQEKPIEEPTSAPKKGLMGGQVRQRKQSQIETGRQTT